VEIGIPLKLLSVGAELRCQHTKSVDDEGNYVTTRQVSGGVTCNVSVVLAFLKLKVAGSIGSYAYGKTAQDHAKHFFRQLVAENINLAQLAPFLSRAAAIGQREAVLNEIREFEHQQKIYLLQQDAISRSLSLLLSQSANRSLQPAVRGQGEIVQPASLAPVNLQAAPAACAKTTIGTVQVSTAQGHAGAGFTPLMLNLKVETSRRIVQAGRKATLCEVLQNQYVDDVCKGKLKRDIAVANSKTKRRVIHFWFGARPPANVHLMLAEQIGCYTQDWHHYRHLHAMHSQGHAGTEAAIGAFHEKYGVKNTAACLCAMATLTADFYANLLEQNASPDLDRLKSAVLKLEQDLYQCPIPQAAEILERQVMASQQVEYVRNEKIVQFSVGKKQDTTGSNPGVKITFSTLEHYNPLRRGDYVTVEFTIGAALDMNRSVLNSIAGYFKAGGTGLHSNFAAGCYARQGTYVVRFFKPALFAGLPYCRLFERRVRQQSMQIGAEVPIPLTGPVTLHASAYYSETSSQFVSETPDADTVLYFVTHYMAALSSGKTDKNGKPVQDSYWYRMEREQSKALKKMFQNLVGHGKKKARLIAELDAFERTFLLSGSEKAKCVAARIKLMNLVRQMADSADTANYLASLEGFKELMRAWYPGWLRLKESSDAYRPWTYRPT